MAAYTSGDWHAKQGREQEFIEAWQDLADWTTREFGWQGWAGLMRDRDDPAHFRSIGEWPEDRLIEQWRASDGFKQRMGKMRELLSDMKIITLDVVAEVHAIAPMA